MDWSKVAGIAIWLAGLAVILTTISFTSLMLRTTNRSGLHFWTRGLDNKWLYSGALLVVTGGLIRSQSLLELGVWALVGVVVGYCWLNTSAKVEATAPKTTQGARVAQPTEVRSSLLKTACYWIVRFELILLALLSPLFLFPDSTRGLVLIILPILWTARRIARGRWVPATPLDWPIALLMIMVLVSVFATYDLKVSLGKIVGLLFGIGLYYAVVEWATLPGRLRTAVFGYALAGCALALVGLLGTSWVDKFPLLDTITARLPHFPSQLTGTASGIHPAEVAGALMWVVPLHFVLALVVWRLPTHSDTSVLALRIGLLVATALTSGTVILTQSRSALLGLGLALTLMVWTAFRRLRPLILALVIIVPVLLVVLGQQAVIDPLLATLGAGARSDDGVNAIEGRGEIWLQALYTIRDFPITGIGMNVFRDWVPLVYPGFNVTHAVDIAHAHNHLLQAALDLGLPGLVAYLAIWMVALVMVVQNYRTTHDSFNAAITVGIGGCLLAYLVYGLTDTVSLGAKPGFFLWALLALLVTLWQQRDVKSDVAADVEAAELT